MVSLFKNNNILYYFDSYGKPVEFIKAKYWINFATQNGMKFVQYTSMQKQSNISTTCGAWVLLFLYQMCYSVKNQRGAKGLDLLQYKSVDDANELIDNEKQLKDITFSIFSNFRELYSKKM